MGRFRSILFAVCALAFLTAMQAQQYAFRAFRQSEGLKNLAINAIAQDRSGFLWLATENGVYRFLGTGFQRFGPEQGIQEAYIINLAADSNGTIWVATLSNVYHWDGQNFISSGQNSMHMRGFGCVAIEDARHLLIIDSDRLYRLEHDASGKTISYRPVFSDAKLAATPELSRVISVSVTNELSGGHRIWFGAAQKLYFLSDASLTQTGQFADGAVKEWGQAQGLLKDDWIGAHLDRSGTLWLAGKWHIMALPSGAQRLIDRTIPGSDPNNVYSHDAILEDRDGRILAAADSGIARWDGGKWQLIGRGNGMPRNASISAMLFDAAGDLWLASGGDGLYYWVGYRNWEGWGEEQNLPAAGIWSILPKPGRVLLGTERGPAWIDRRTAATGQLSSLRPWVYGQVAFLGRNDHELILVATFANNLLRIDPRSGRTEKIAKLPANIISALQLAPDQIFFATASGLFAWDGNSQPHRIPAVDALIGTSAHVVKGCSAPDGSAWFLTENRLLHLANGHWTLPTPSGMPQLSTRFIGIDCAPDGSIWATGQQTGTWRITASGDRLQAQQLPIPEDFSSLAPVVILIDRHGWLWLGTDTGLLVWNGHQWRHLTQESGLPWNDINEATLTADPDGTLWIGTSGGVAHLLHPESVFDPIPVTIALTRVRRGPISYLGRSQFTMPWDGPPLSVQFASPTMRNRSELILKIRINGLHTDWMETWDGIATIPRFDPGKYSVAAMACNPSLNACSTIVQVDVTVLPPWWRNNWFYILCGLLFLLLLVTVDSLRERHLRIKSRELKRLVLERTQELEDSRAQLRVQANHDGLTGMLNRTAILRALTTEMERAQREQRNLVIALADIDFFKHVNDTHGHLAGDEALRVFAAAVAKAIRPYDHAGRYGGEEFLLVLSQIPGEAVEERLNSLQRSISNLQVESAGSQFQLNCSMGATVFNPSNSDGAATVESLLTTTDKALYMAKAEGRNRVVLRPSGSHSA